MIFLLTRGDGPAVEPPAAPTGLINLTRRALRVILIFFGG